MGSDAQTLRPDRPAGLVAMAVLVAVAGVAVLIVGGGMVADPAIRTGGVVVIVVGMIGLFWSITVYVNRLRTPGRRGPVLALAVDRHTGESGVAIRSGRAQDILWLGMLLTLFLVLVVVSFGAAHLAGTAEDGSRLIVVALITAGMALVMVRTLFNLLRHGAAALVLTPHGLSHRLFSASGHVAWADIMEVDATGYPSMAVLLDLGTELVTVPVMLLRADPTLVLRACRHYHRHPEHRPELATAAGLDRMRHAGQASSDPW